LLFFQILPNKHTYCSSKVCAAQNEFAWPPAYGARSWLACAAHAYNLFAAATIVRFHTALNDEWRFRVTSFPEEWIETYHPGGLHPIHIGDTLRNGRFHVIQKLGYVLHQPHGWYRTACRCLEVCF
jgi:hypothetical protein